MASLNVVEAFKKMAISHLPCSEWAIDFNSLPFTVSKFMVEFRFRNYTARFFE